MKASNVFLVLLFSVTLLMGCDEIINIYESETILSDTKDRVYPLNDGVYFHLTSLSSTNSGLSSDEISQYLSPTEQLLLSSGIRLPGKFHLLIKKNKNYYQIKSGNPGHYLVAVFENIQDQIYLIEMMFDLSTGRVGDMCPEKGNKTKTLFSLVKIQDNHIYFSSFDRAIKDFNKWVASLSSITRWRYDIKTIGKDSWKLTGTKAIKAFTRERASSFTFGDGLSFVLKSEASQYKKEIKLYSKIQKIKSRLASEKAQKLAEQKKREEAEKNDGVIRYAFGRKLGAKKTSRYDSITYWNVTEVADKSGYFQDYYELTTPESMQVFSIYGISQNLDATTCRTRAKEVMSVLRVKYDTSAPHAPVGNRLLGKSQKDVDESFLYFRRIEQEKHGKLIELICVTDSKKIKEKKEKFKATGCKLDQNLYDRHIANRFVLNISKYTLYHQYPYPGYSDYNYSIIPISVPGNTFYPAPVPSESISYNQNFRKCELNKNNDIFKLFIRYSDTELEGLIKTERDNIRRAKTLNSKKAKGL